MSINFEKQPQLVKDLKETASPSKKEMRNRDLQRFISNALTFCFIVIAIVAVRDIASGHVLDGAFTGPLVHSMQGFSENMALWLIGRK